MKEVGNKNNKRKKSYKKPVLKKMFIEPLLKNEGEIKSSLGASWCEACGCCDLVIP